MKSVFDEWLIMFERPASTVEKWYRITTVGEFLDKSVLSGTSQGILLMNWFFLVLYLRNRPVEPGLRPTVSKIIPIFCSLHSLPSNDSFKYDQVLPFSVLLFF